MRGFGAVVRRCWIRAATVVAAAGAGLALLSSCQLATPFGGAGYSRSDGVTLDGAGETVVVSVTNAQLDSSKRRPFDKGSAQVIKSLPEHDGYIGHSLRTRVLGNEVWTMTVWRDEAALDAFVTSPVHRQAMRDGITAIRRGKFLRFEYPTESVPPSWDEILERLENVEAIEYDAARLPPTDRISRTGR